MYCKIEVIFPSFIYVGLHRRAHLFKLAMGQTEATTDYFYVALEDRMFLYEQTISKCRSTIIRWLEACQAFVEYQERLVVAWEDVYLCSASETFGSERIHIQEWRKKSQYWINGESDDNEDDHATCIQSVRQQVETVLLPQIDFLTSLFEGPRTLMRKRAGKLLDYDRIRDLENRNDAIDPTLAKSSKDYIILHGQLVEELPMFMGLVGEYITEVMIWTVESLIAKRWWLGQVRSCESLLKSKDDRFHDPSTDLVCG